MTNLAAEAVNAATVRPVIVRACVRCGGTRQLGALCASCGNPDAPVVHDLGVQAAVYASPVKRLAWNAVGQRLAARRARQANKYVEK